MTACQAFIALIGHLVYPALYTCQPDTDVCGKGHITGDDILLLFVLLDGLAQQLLRLSFIALYRQVGLDPFLLPLAVYMAVENDIVLVILDLQTSCHNISFPDSWICLLSWVRYRIACRLDKIHQARLGDDDLAANALAAQTLFTNQPVHAGLADAQSMGSFGRGHYIGVFSEHIQAPLKRLFAGIRLHFQLTLINAAAESTVCFRLRQLYIGILGRQRNIAD